jgi:hypothetical protein
VTIFIITIQQYEKNYARQYIYKYIYNIQSIKKREGKVECKNTGRKKTSFQLGPPLFWSTLVVIAKTTGIHSSSEVMFKFY